MITYAIGDDLVTGPHQRAAKGGPAMSAETEQKPRQEPKKPMTAEQRANLEAALAKLEELILRLTPAASSTPQ